MPDLPIKSYHCTTTHSACDYVLERLKKLEKVVEAIKNERKVHDDCYCDCNSSSCLCLPCLEREEITDRALEEL